MKSSPAGRMPAHGGPRPAAPDATVPEVVIPMDDLGADVAGRKCTPCPGASCIGDCGDASTGKCLGFGDRNVSKPKNKAARLAEIQEKVRETVGKKWACGLVDLALESLKNPDIAHKNNFIISVTLKGSTEAFQVAPRDPGAKPASGTLEEHIEAARASFEEVKKRDTKASCNKEIGQLAREFHQLNNTGSSGGVTPDVATLQNDPEWKKLVDSESRKPRNYSFAFGDMKVVFQDSPATGSDSDDEKEGVSSTQAKKRPHRSHTHSRTEGYDSDQSSASEIEDEDEEYDDSTDSEADEFDELFDIPEPEYGVRCRSAATAPASSPQASGLSPAAQPSASTVPPVATSTANPMADYPPGNYTQRPHRGTRQPGQADQPNVNPYRLQKTV